MDNQRNQKNQLEFFERLLNIMPGNLYWKDPQGYFLGCNQNQADIFKLNSPRDVVGKTHHDLLDKNLAELMSNADKRVIAENKILELEEIALDAKDNLTTYLTRKIPLHDDQGGIIGLLSFSVDITALKKISEGLTEHAHPAEKQARHKKSMSVKQIINVLIVEDEPIAKAAVQGTLQKLGCIISSAENVSKALQLLQENKYDLVISDLGLPDGNGTYIIEAIKANKKHLNYDTPFVALTANTSEEQLKEFSEKGLHIIQKPLEAEKAKELIDTYVIPQKNKNSEKSVIDLEAAEVLLGDNRALAESTLKMLISSLPETKKTFQEILQNNAVEKMKNELHKFKGGLGYCGVPALQKVVTEIYKQIQETQDLKTLEPEIKQMFLEIDKVISAYRTYIAKS